MPRFVILEHSQLDQPTHWDLMLEEQGKLLTWKVPQPPEKWGDQPIDCKKIFDHRLKYLDYEGAVSEGRGSVTQSETGTYRRLAPGENLLHLELSGSAGDPCNHRYQTRYE